MLNAGNLVRDTKRLKKGNSHKLSRGSGNHQRCQGQARSEQAKVGSGSVNLVKKAGLGSCIVWLKRRARFDGLPGK